MELTDPKTRELIGVTLLLLLICAVGVLYLEPDANSVLLTGMVGNLCIPALMGFGWMRMWIERSDPSRFLAVWSAAALGISLAVTFASIMSSAWGLTGLAVVLLTGALVVVYLGGYYEGRRGRWSTILLMTLNTCAAYWLILNNLDRLNPWLLDPSTPTNKTLLGMLLTDVSVMGTLASLTPQIFLHDYVGKKREKEAMDALMTLLDERDEKTQSLQ